MIPPPIAYWAWLVAVCAGYGLSARLVKKRYLRHHPAWL